MAEQFEAGDVVVLKSGGPSMTIKRIGTFSGVVLAECDWFESKKHVTGRFTLPQLEKSSGPRA